MPESQLWPRHVLCLAAFWSSSVLVFVAACPSGWTQGSSASRCHKVLTQNAAFNDVKAARDLCRTEGADLATITDSSEQNVISGLVSNLGGAYTDVYIGAMDVLGDGTHTWLDNVTVYNYESFQDAYDPSNVRHLADRCVALYSADASWSAVAWRRLACCFGRGVRVVACTKPDVGVASVAVDELARFCTGDCPTGSYRHNDTCYMVKREATAMDSTYSARRSCLADSYDLADVVPGLVFDHVVSILADQSVPSGELVYTGLNNLSAINEFVTADGAAYKPSSLITVDTCSYNSGSEQCIALQTTSTTWNISSTVYCPRNCCVDLGITYIVCERPMNSPVSIIPNDSDPFAIECYKDIDECLSNPCINGATCQDKILSYNCQCQQGYTGVNCDSVIDNCASVPCLHNQNCTSYIGYYVCNCEPGYEGVNCETDINECVNVTCLNGGTCDDLVNKAVCLCTPKYTGTLCETLIKCPEVPPVGNATVLSLQNSEVGDTATITCQQGLRLRDRSPNRTLTCLSATGDWDYPVSDLGNCEYHCDALPDVVNAHVENAATEYGSQVAFVCDKGYLFPDNTTRVNITCLNTGLWTQTNISDCEIIKCPPLPEWDHQTVDTLNHTYDTTVTFWCDVGYELHDHTTARTIKCKLNGDWTAPLPPCQPVKCPVIDMPPSWHIRRDNDSVTYGTVVTYQCEDDMRMLDGATFREIKCDATGEWSDNITDCRSERCFPLPFVANATPSTLEANYETVSNLKCIEGHRFDGKYRVMSMYCNNDGWWRPILSACEPILCPVLADVLNTATSTDSRLFNTTVDYRCIKGHYYYPNMTSVVSVRCLDSEQWNNTDLDPCWPVVCNAPPDISNGTRVLPPDDNFNYSAQVSYECAQGYKFIDGKIKRTIECNEFGEWNVSDVSCRSERCSPVPTADNVIPDTTNTTWYTNVTYSCQRGYEWPNNKSTHRITCENTGRWNDVDIPPCTIKKCSAVERMPNATTNTSEHVYNTYVEYACDVGFKYPDNETAKTKWCSDMATWQPGEFPECEIVYCPELEDVENATRNSNDTFYNSHVMYSCLPGYQFPDKSKAMTIYCTENETWSDSPPPCEVVFCPPVPWWTETVFNSTVNEFKADVAYWCEEGYFFKDSFNKPDTVKTSTCTHAKIWDPPIDDCLAKDDIAADLRGVTYESPNSVSIGTIACSLTVTVLCCIVLLDTKKLYSDVQLMKRNVTSFVREMKARNGRRNKVSDSRVNIQNNADGP